jgi:hypothetical protein
MEPDGSEWMLRHSLPLRDETALFEILQIGPRREVRS